MIKIIAPHITKLWFQSQCYFNGLLTLFHNFITKKKRMPARNNKKNMKKKCRHKTAYTTNKPNEKTNSQLFAIHFCCLILFYGKYLPVHNFSLCFVCELFFFSSLYSRANLFFFVYLLVLMYSKQKNIYTTACSCSLFRALLWYFIISIYCSFEFESELFRI